MARFVEVRGEALAALEETGLICLDDEDDSVADGDVLLIRLPVPGSW